MYEWENNHSLSAHIKPLNTFNSLKHAIQLGLVVLTDYYTYFYTNDPRLVYR